jgi:MFS transporter, SHS family, sialic acid transporter
MASGSTSAPTMPGKGGQWLVLIAALLGWMFDGLEMGLFPLVARPALGDLLQTTDKSILDTWIAIITAMFLIGAASGGVLFGWLGDRIGRVRAMTFSVLTYAIFSGACGLANEAWQVAMFRFLAALGMGGEWSLGVALVMEVWPNRSRAWLAGVIGAAANFGYMIIGVVALVLAETIGDLATLLLRMGISVELKDKLVAHSGWRLLMLFGAVPALLTVLIRLFVPESGRWKVEKKAGATSHWETHDLLGLLVGIAAACWMIALFTIDTHWAIRLGGGICAFIVVALAYMHPIRRYLHRLSFASGTMTVAQVRENRGTIRRMLLGAALSGVALLGTWGTQQQAPSWVSDLPNGNRPEARALTQMAGAIGAIFGCVLAALAGDWFGRRKTYAFLCIGSMLAILALFNLNTEFGTPLLIWAGVSGAITAAFYGWLPLYLPELFRTRVRATGQGFSFNFGRVLAAIGVMQLPAIMRLLGGGFSVACPALSLIYIVGFVLIWFAPETRGKPLPDDLPEVARGEAERMPGPPSTNGDADGSFDRPEVERLAR